MEPLRTSRRPYRAHARGVTVVELLVVLAIIGILVAVVITSHATFNKTIILNYTAYDVALTIRSAETFGLGSRTTSSGSDSNAGYGLHFTTGDDSFILFSDRNAPGSKDKLGTSCHPLADSIVRPDSVPGNCIYDTGEDVQTYKLGNGMTFGQLQWYGGPYVTDTLDVVFSRPNPHAYIANNGEYNANISACIPIKSQQGTKAYIYVRPSGQVTVSAGDCP